MRIAAVAWWWRVLTGRPHLRRAGMFLERMNGKSVSKVIGSADFCDVQYIRDMLFEVFTALDAAQRAFG